MIKFSAFERTIEFLYKYVVPVKRDDLGKPAQLVVTFGAGYIAGVCCAVASHPFDSVVSKLNSDIGSTPWQAAKDLGMIGEWYSIGLFPSLYENRPGDFCEFKLYTGSNNIQPVDTRLVHDTSNFSSCENGAFLLMEATVLSVLLLM